MMPSFEEHCKFSELRTGKRYEDLHKWMDEFQKEMGVNHREKRHSLNDCEEVRRRWGDEGVIEFLVHVIADYKDTTRKLLNLFSKIKIEKTETIEKFKQLIDEYNELLDEAESLEYATTVGVPWGLSSKFIKKQKNI